MQKVLAGGGEGGAEEEGSAGGLTTCKALKWCLAHSETSTCVSRSHSSSKPASRKMGTPCVLALGNK